MAAYIIVGIVAYLIGSISFSVILSKKMAGFDVREKGSGNAGATNMLRSVGKKAAVLTLVCDALKGVVAIIFAIIVYFILAMTIRGDLTNAVVGNRVLDADNFGNRLYFASYNTKEFMLSIVESVKQLFTGKVSSAELVGPVGISEVVAKTNGFREFIYILAAISISLGVTNLLPFPPLDGGKIVLILLEAIRRKPLKQETEIKIQLAGFAILMAVSIVVTYHDIVRIF